MSFLGMIIVGLCVIWAASLAALATLFWSDAWSRRQSRRREVRTAFRLNPRLAR